MALTPEQSTPRGTGTATRVGIAAQVALTTALALVLVLLVDWLSERPGLRLRVDLTRDESNTLSAASREVLERLPVDVRFDIFFQGRALERGLDALGREAQEHARKVLRLVQEEAPGRIECEEHDLSDRRGTEGRAYGRLAELELREVEAGGVVVVSAGRRREVLHLRGDLCDLDPGFAGDALQPPMPPRIVALRAEEAVVSALHKVAAELEPKILFTKGHGELDLASTDPGGLAELKLALEADGFQVAAYDIEQQGPLPPACNLLAILAPEQPFTEEETRTILLFLESGGRLIAAPEAKADYDGPGSLAALLTPYGIQPRMRGLLARPVAQASGAPMTGIPQCAMNVIVWSAGMAAQNPVTEPLRRAGRRVYLPFARALDRSTPIPGGNAFGILFGSEEDWCDLPDASAEQKHDWQPGVGEPSGTTERFVLAMQAVYPARKPPPKERAVAAGRPEGRILCVGSALAFANQLVPANRDFLLNAFNWASSREYRVSVAVKSPQARRIDVGQGTALATIHLVAVILLPLLFLSLGLFTAWKRRR